MAFFLNANVAVPSVLGEQSQNEADDAEKTPPVERRSASMSGLRVTQEYHPTAGANLSVSRARTVQGAVKKDRLPNGK